LMMKRLFLVAKRLGIHHSQFVEAQQLIVVVALEASE
jgi:hypothetical protein